MIGEFIGVFCQVLTGGVACCGIYDLFTDYYEDLSSKTRDMNKLLQTQLNNIYDEMMKYKVRKSMFSQPCKPCIETTL